MNHTVVKDMVAVKQDQVYLYVFIYLHIFMC